MGHQRHWFYAAFIVAVGLLHVVNNIVVPASLTKSYPVYSGSVDAMAQWWYGHNAVAFFWAVNHDQFEDLDTPAQ